MPARPHSPDCLLWAKNLKDEHIKLKVRMTSMEGAAERHKVDIESLKGSLNTLDTMPGELTTLAGRITSIETRDAEPKSLHESLTTAIRNEVSQLEEKVKTQENKITCLERINTELREDHEEAHQANEALWDRLKAHEAVMDGFSRMSPKVLRKNDTSSTTALARMVEVMRNGQQNDHQTIQKLQAQVHGLINLFNTQPCHTDAVSPEKTPSVTNSSSPFVQVAGSPLLEKGTQVRLGKLRMHNGQNMPRDISPTKRVAQKALEQTAVASQRRPPARGYKGRGEAAGATSKHSEQTTIGSPAQPVKPSERHKAVPLVSQRQTRSQKKASSSKSQAVPAVTNLDPSEPSSKEGVGKVLPPALRPAAEQEQESSRVGEGTESRTIVAHCQRKRRKISIQPALPPLEDMSE